MALNRIQRVIVRIGGCLVLFNLLFPPWITETKRKPFGNYFIFTPPVYDIAGFGIPLMVDTTLLFLRTLAIVTGTALLVWWCHSRQATTKSPSDKTSERAVLQQSWDAQQKLLPAWQRLFAGEEIKRLFSLWEGQKSRLRWLLLVALCLGLLVLLTYSNP